MPEFSGPSYEQAFESLRGQTAKELLTKAATLFVVGISPEQVEEQKFPVLYSLATFYYVGATGSLRRQPGLYSPEDPERHPRWTDYSAALARDDEGNILMEHGVPKPEMVEKVMETPEKAFQEEYDPDYIINVEQYPQYAPLWWREGRALLYRQPTGRLYNPTEHGSPEEAIVRMTKALRNAFWATPLANKLRGDRGTLHEALFKAENMQWLHEQLVRSITGSVHKQSIKRFAVGEQLEEGFQLYKVAVVIPEGITGIYDDVDSALAAAQKVLEQQEAEPLAAKLSKKDFLTAMVEIGNELDREGAKEETEVLDQVLKSMVDEECSDKTSF